MIGKNKQVICDGLIGIGAGLIVGALINLAWCCLIGLNIL